MMKNAKILNLMSILNINLFFRIGTLILAGNLLLVSCGKNNDAYQLSSPDEKITIGFKLKAGKPLYSIHHKSDTVIRMSELGLDMKSGIQSDSKFQVLKVSRNSFDETWKPVWGIHETYRNHYNELTVCLEVVEEPKYRLDLIFRVYNDGAAFRYHIPEQPGLSDFIIASEETRFRIPDDPNCFIHIANEPGRYQNVQETMSFSEIDPASYVSVPLLMELESSWISIMEADLTDYAGMTLVKDSMDSESFYSVLDTINQNNEVDLVDGTAPHSSPWRVVMVGEQGGKFMESPLIYNLNDPSVLEDESWIKPGKATWLWWNDRIVSDPGIKTRTMEAPHGIQSGDPSTEVLKYYVDFTARNEIPYMLICVGYYGLETDVWADPENEDVFSMEETREDYYDLHEVIKYAHEKDVDILLWVHLGSILSKEKVDTVLTTFAQWGVKGIKPDYFAGEDQDLVNHVHYMLKVAAENKMLVNYHGAYKPTGVQRTYPNYITTEAIHGMEYTKWDSSTTLEHYVVIPYTRMLSGPMDFTPGAFDIDGAEGFPKYIKTTRAQQIAMYVVYFSPLQMLIDYPQAYESAPEQFEFIKQVPVTWDETKFIKGYPGDYIALARRKGSDWFVGVMNDEQTGRKVSFSFDFLEKGKEYTARIYKDAPDADENPQNVVVEEMTVTAGDEHSVVMPKGGGEAIWFEAQ